MQPGFGNLLEHVMTDLEIIVTTAVVVVIFAVKVWILTKI
jgi:hypothetical protein